MTGEKKAFRQGLDERKHAIPENRGKDGRIQLYFLRGARSRLESFNFELLILLNPHKPRGVNPDTNWRLSK